MFIESYFPILAHLSSGYSSRGDFCAIAFILRFGARNPIGCGIIKRGITFSISMPLLIFAKVVGLLRDIKKSASGWKK